MGEVVFRKLYSAAVARLEEIDNFISVQVDIRFNTFCDRIRGTELNRLLNEGQGPSHQAPNPAAPPPHPRTGTFKPNESFLENRKKTYPWYTVGSTCVPSEERDAISDYLNSGGDFNNVSTPTIYIKKLFDAETLKAFIPLLHDAVNNQKRDPNTKTIVECIVEVVMSRVPRRARLATVLNRIKSSNCMGDLGENMLTFSEGLMHDLHQSSWETTNAVEIGVLLWIADLNMANQHHLRLSDKIHSAWDLAEKDNLPFSIMNCVEIARSHWAKVRESMLTMGPGTSGATTTTVTSDPTAPKKKKNRKKKKGSGTPTDGVAAAATKTVTVPPQTPGVTQKPPTPKYCFRCGEDAHTINECKHIVGALKCDRHSNTNNHLTKACSVWRREQGLLVHPWLERKQATANQVLIEGEDQIFGSHPDDSLECISESDTSLTQPSGLHACQVMVSGAVSTDDEEEVEDAPARTKRRFPKDKIPAVWRQSCQGRQRAKDPPPTARTHGRILLHHYSMAAASEDDSVPAYNLLMAKKVPSKSVSNEMPPTKVLLDTGASVSLMPAWRAAKLGLEVKPRRDICIRGADGQPLAIQGTGEIWVRPM